jgi:hypothetical protein
VNITDSLIVEEKNIKFFALKSGTNNEYDFYIKDYLICPKHLITKDQCVIINDYQEREHLQNLQADHTRFFTQEEFERLQSLNKKITPQNR